MADASLANPGAVFERCADMGSAFLEQVRAQVTAPGQRKQLRRWGISAAAALVGRSTQSLRQLEASGDPWLDQLGAVSRDTNGKRLYTLEQINAYRDHFGTRERRPPRSRPIRCAVTNFKGGAGKTTTAVHLVQKCALEGLKVLAIDLDPQASFTRPTAPDAATLRERGFAAWLSSIQDPFYAAARIVCSAQTRRKTCSTPPLASSNDLSARAYASPEPRGCSIS